MLSALCLYTADASLGRIDTTSLPHQSLIELMYENLALKNKALYQNDSNEWRDACSLNIVTCDNDQNVIKFCEMENLKGTLHIEYLPKTLQEFFVFQTEVACHGKLETSLLPPHLSLFELSQTKFDGTVDMRALPKDLVVLYIPDNDFSGSCDLTALPETLVELCCQSNKFSGSISLDSLPETLCTLNLAKNELSGSLSFNALPAGMDSLRLHTNAFVGEIDARAIPGNIREMMLGFNGFVGTAHIRGDTDCQVFCNETKIEAFLDENGEVHPRAAEFAELTYDSDNEEC